jgi:hypothetical protein
VRGLRFAIDWVTGAQRKPTVARLPPVPAKNHKKRASFNNMGFAARFALMAMNLESVSSSGSSKWYLKYHRGPKITY